MTDAHGYYEQRIRPVEARPSEPVIELDHPTPLPVACRCKASTVVSNGRDVTIPCVEPAGTGGLCPRCTLECTQPNQEAA